MVQSKIRDPSKDADTPARCKKRKFLIGRRDGKISCKARGHPLECDALALVISWSDWTSESG